MLEPAEVREVPHMEGGLAVNPWLLGALVEGLMRQTGTGY